MWRTVVSTVHMMPVQFSPIRYPTSLRSSFDFLEFMDHLTAKNHWNRIKQYLRKSRKLTFYVWRTTYCQIRWSIWKCALIFFFVLKHFATFYKTDFFPKNPSLTLLHSVFAYSSELVLINECVNINQQHCVINKVRNYHGEVEKTVADFYASELK